MYAAPVVPPVVHYALPDGDVAIRPITAGDSLADLTALLHRAYAPLAAQGFRFFATHQSEQETADRVRDALCLVGMQAAEPVATICLYHRRDPDGICTWYQRAEVWRFGQFAVEPRLQRSGLGRRLIGLVEDVARRNGAGELALDTAEGAVHLTTWYARLGYRPVETVQWQVTNYRSVVMSKTLAD